MPDTAAGDKDEDTDDCHAGNLYRQALFTLDDAEMAEQVVSDVIVEECVWRAAAVRGQDAGVGWRSLPTGGAWNQPTARAWTSRVPRAPNGRRCRPRRSGRAERQGAGVFGLVLFGGRGCRQVGVDLGISASDVAGMLRAALGTAAAAETGSLPCGNQERVWP